MTQLGGVYSRGGQHFACINTALSGVRYYMEGPLRTDEKGALQDLASIRAAAEGETPRAEGLQAMQLAAKDLREEAKAATRGGIKAIDSDRFSARIQYFENSGRERLLGHLDERSAVLKPT